MNPYANEEIMWQRLKDMQREAENSRLFVQGTVPRLANMAALLGRRAWWLSGLAIRRAPRRSPLRVVEPERDGASRVA
jgi:hypothetical protein